MDLTDVERLLGDIDPEPWILTERSSPGWRVESYGEKAVCFGPEDLHTAVNGRFIAIARSLVPSLIARMRHAENEAFALQEQCKDGAAALVLLAHLRVEVQAVLDETEEPSTVAVLGWLLDSLNSLDVEVDDDDVSVLA